MSWHARAACRDTDPELFFPEQTDSETRARALAVCRACPVAAECLAESITSHGIGHGIVGATTEYERRCLVKQLGRRTGRAARKTPITPADVRPYLDASQQTSPRPVSGAVATREDTEQCHA